MPEQLFRNGPMQLTVRSLSDSALDGIPGPFVALLPAIDLARLPETTSLVPDLLDNGCVDIILAGARADAYHQQIGALLKQTGAHAAASPYPDLGDACNATLLGALVHHSGLALCADAPELLDMLRTASQANGWTATTRPSNKSGAMKPIASAKSGAVKAIASEKSGAVKPVASAKSGPMK